MSVFVTCDGTVSVDGGGALTCTGNWATIEDTTVLNSGTLTPAEWRYVWEGLIWVFLAAAAWISLMRVVQRMTTKEEADNA